MPPSPPVPAPPAAGPHLAPDQALPPLLRSCFRSRGNIPNARNRVPPSWTRLSPTLGVTACPPRGGRRQRNLRFPHRGGTLFGQKSSRRAARYETTTRSLDCLARTARGGRLVAGPRAHCPAEAANPRGRLPVRQTDRPTPAPTPPSTAIQIVKKSGSLIGSILNPSKT